jgi:fructose-bisphosphate aldolase class II
MKLIEAAEQDTGLPTVFILITETASIYASTCIDGGFTSVMIDGTKAQVSKTTLPLRKSR